MGDGVGAGHGGVGVGVRVRVRSCAHVGCERRGDGPGGVGQWRVGLGRAGEKEKRRPS